MRRCAEDLLQKRSAGAHIDKPNLREYHLQTEAMWTAEDALELDKMTPEQLKRNANRAMRNAQLRFQGLKSQSSATNETNPDKLLQTGFASYHQEQHKGRQQNVSDLTTSSLQHKDCVNSHMVPKKHKQSFPDQLMAPSTAWETKMALPIQSQKPVLGDKSLLHEHDIKQVRSNLAEPVHFLGVPQESARFGHAGGGSQNIRLHNQSQSTGKVHQNYGSESASNLDAKIQRIKEEAYQLQIRNYLLDLGGKDFVDPFEDD